MNRAGGFRMSFMRLSVLITIIFLVAFPKAGFKAQEIPITFGYIWIGVLGFASLFSGSIVKTTIDRAITIGALIPLWCISVITLWQYGTDHFGLTLSFLVGFLLLPVILVLLMWKPINKLDIDHFLFWLKHAIRFVSMYGIFLFFYRYLSGQWFEIPYLTVNADDYGNLDEKMINRGTLFKLISTYNNGNIFGVCMLMLLPLYDKVESSKIFHFLVRIALVMTLSRTVWLGLIFYEIIRSTFSRKLNIKKFVLLVSSLLLSCIGIWFVLIALERDFLFIFDRNLGGRYEKLNQTDWSQFLTNRPVSWVSEIIVVNIINALGIAGLLAFLLATLTPIILTWKKNNTVSRSCSFGMIMLLICGLSDGPILLIPVMAFFWGLTSIGLRTDRYCSLNNPSISGYVSSFNRSAPEK